MNTLSNDDVARPVYFQHMHPVEITLTNDFSAAPTSEFEMLMQQAVHQALENMISQPGEIAFFAHPVESNPVIIL